MSACGLLRKKFVRGFSMALFFIKQRSMLDASVTIHLGAVSCKSETRSSDAGRRYPSICQDPASRQSRLRPDSERACVAVQAFNQANYTINHPNAGRAFREVAEASHGLQNRLRNTLLSVPAVYSYEFVRTTAMDIAAHGAGASFGRGVWLERAAWVNVVESRDAGGFRSVRDGESGVG